MPEETQIVSSDIGYETNLILSKRDHEDKSKIVRRSYKPTVILGVKKQFSKILTNNLYNVIGIGIKIIHVFFRFTIS
jgi:hypothetical protein